ncbi:MAG: hypothetical protein FWG97_04710 [Deltaproteobacteria bacterium]|nr:hypothetical protein [Deltaproteobacteria bacterium]
MDQARLNQGRWRRGVLLAFLCALVYFVSYDHGRQSLKPRLQEQESQFLEERNRLLTELGRLEERLALCQAPGPAGQTPIGRIALKENQSRTLFDDRLVLSILSIDNEAGRAVVRLNFVRENRQASEELAVGDSLGFSLGGRDWAVVVAGLTLTTANLNIVEIISDP